jgi:hypothetical protein
MTNLHTPVERGSPTKPAQRRLLASESRLAFGIIGVGVLGLLVLLALSAFDVLALLVVAGVLFGLERTAGDWLADALGPFLSKVVFMGGVGVATSVMLSFGSVRDAIWLGLEKADDVGFHSVLIDHMSRMPAAEPIKGGEPSSGGGGAVPQPMGARPEGGRTDSRLNVPSRGDQPTRTRPVLRLGGQGGAVHFAADIIASGVTVDDGYVEFSIDGRRVASAKVMGGRAEARVVGVSSGSHRASARFLGTARFGESIAEAAFTR